MGAYYFYTKPIDFLFFCGFYSKPKAYEVSLGYREQDYKINIFENGRKRGHFGRTRRSLPLLLSLGLLPLLGPMVFVKNLSIFSFSMVFSKNQRQMQLVSDPGDKVMSSIYLKMR